MIWIRTQEKAGLIEAENLYIAWNDKDFEYVIICDQNDSEFIVSHYSTKEKALKVLDMIQKIIVDNGYMEAGMPRAFSTQHCVFEMPQDDEVVA